MQEMFAAGDHVVWAERDLSPISLYVQEYGYGPFKVLEVRSSVSTRGISKHPQELVLEVVRGRIFKEKMSQLKLSPPADIWVNGSWLRKIAA